MAILESTVDTRGAEFAENRARFEALVAELRERVALAQRGGDEEARRRHTGRGKLLVRDRIARLTDPDTPSWSSARWRPGTCTTVRRPPPGS